MEGQHLANEIKHYLWIRGVADPIVFDGLMVPRDPDDPGIQMFRSLDRKQSLVVEAADILAHRLVAMGDDPLPEDVKVGF